MKTSVRDVRKASQELHEFSMNKEFDPSIRLECETQSILLSGFAETVERLHRLEATMTTVCQEIREIRAMLTNRL